MIRRPTLRLALSSLGLVLYSGAHSATATDEVVLIGSRLPQTKPSVSLSVLDQDTAIARGYLDIQQALDGLAMNSGGGVDQQRGAFGSFTPAAASLNLRDLGAGRALILLNGRRLPMYPIGINGTESFVDISALPSAAIERIEVLTDGASALYGSDAMSGVVNVVLKRSPSNSIGLTRSGTTQGGRDAQRWSLNIGAERDGSRALFSVEYDEAQRLGYNQRERSRSDRLGGAQGAGPGSFSPFGFPGTYTNASETAFTPAAGCSLNAYTPSVTSICQFNRAEFRELRPATSGWNGIARLGHALNKDSEVFLDAVLRNSKTTSQYEAQDLDVRYDLGISDISASVPGTPYGNTGSYWRRLLELGPRARVIDNHSSLTTLGMTGAWQDWRWQTGLTHARQAINEAYRGLVLISELRAAILGQRDFNGDGNADIPNFTQRLPDDMATALGYTAHSQASSTLTSVDAALTGSLAQLTQGPLQAVLAADYTRERYQDQRDPQVLSGNVLTTSGTNGAGRRARSSLAVELKWPLTQRLDANFAARYDRYHDASSVGGASNPRLAMQWRATKQWQIDASVGRNFRAPDMQRLFGGNVNSVITLINTPKCQQAGGSNCTSTVRAAVLTRANGQLSDEHGVHYSLGTRWQPSDAIDTSLNYYMIDLRDVVQRPDGQYVLDRFAQDGSYADWITFNPSTACQSSTPPNSGCVSLDLRPVNIAYKKTSGLDATVKLQQRSALGLFTQALTINYLLSVRMRDAYDRPEVDVLAKGQLGEAARIKGGVDFGWQWRAWRSHVFVDYIGAFTPLITTLQSRIGSFTTVNANVTYRFAQGSEIQGGFNNLFDREPPVATYFGSNSAPFYHSQFHDLDGRAWLLRINHHF